MKTGNLLLTLRMGDSVVIDGGVKVTLVKKRLGQGYQLAIRAPLDTDVKRLKREDDPAWKPMPGTEESYADF